MRSPVTFLLAFAVGLAAQAAFAGVPVTMFLTTLHNPIGVNAMPAIFRGGPLAGGAPIPYTAGTLSFFANGSPIPGCSGLSSPNQLVENCTATLPVGVHAIQVAFDSSGGTYDSKLSDPLLLTVEALSTPDWNLRALPSNPAPVGSTVGLQVLLFGYAPVAASPGGTVTVYSGATAVCSNLALVQSQATCNMPLTTRGTFPITFQYSGDASWKAFTSTPRDMVVTGKPVGIALSSSAPHAGLGTAVTLTATVTDAQTSAALSNGEGTVTFRNAQAPISSCTNVPVVGGVATCVATFARGASLLDAAFTTTGNYENSAPAALRQLVGSRPHGFDLDADGRADLLLVRPGYGVLWRMAGLSIVESREFADVSGYPIAQFADVNGDGRSDAILREGTGGLVASLVNGTSFGTSNGTLAIAGSGWSVADAADFDNDGRQDLLVVRADGTAGVWIMSGTSIGASATLLGPGSGWAPAGTGDFDGDGKADILWKHADGRHAIWLMNGVTLKSGLEVLGAGSGWFASHVADFDGDGRSDILWRHPDGSQAIWLMNGLAIASGAGVLPAGTGWTITLTGDFNGDGRDDLYFEHADGRAAIYLMDGLAPLQTTQILNAGSGWRAKRVQDLDGDGRDDLVWVHDDGRIAAWLMNGAAMASGQELLGAGTPFSLSIVNR